MRKILSLILIFVVILAVPIPVTAITQVQAKRIPVTVDDLPVTFDVQPIVKNGRTLVPFRAIAESLNVRVSWDGKTQNVNATDGKTSIRLQINSKYAYQNNNRVILQTPPMIIQGRTLIPIRFFSEAFGCQVAWDSTINGVRITSPVKAMTVTGYYALGDSATSSWKDLFGLPYPQSEQGNSDMVSNLALGWYSLDSAGHLLTRSTTGWQRPDGWEKVLETAGTYKLNTEMVVHLTDKDGAITSILSSDTAMLKAADEIAAEAALYQGVNLDLEGLGNKETGAQLTAVRNSFSKFAKLLSDKLKPSGLTLSLSLHAPNSAYKGYDYKALGAVADRIIIMAYDYGPKPEPVNQVIQAVQQALNDVPANKLVLAISIPSETPRSIIAKVGIAKRYNLQGIALWRLGLLTDEMWNSLRTTVQAKK